MTLNLTPWCRTYNCWNNCCQSKWRITLLFTYMNWTCTSSCEIEIHRPFLVTCHWSETTTWKDRQITMLWHWHTHLSWTSTSVPIFNPDISTVVQTCDGELLLMCCHIASQACGWFLTTSQHTPVTLHSDRQSQKQKRKNNCECRKFMSNAHGKWHD